MAYNLLAVTGPELSDHCGYVSPILRALSKYIVVSTPPKGSHLHQIYTQNCHCWKETPFQSIIFEASNVILEKKHAHFLKLTVRTCQEAIPKGNESSSNHTFSGALVVSFREDNTKNLWIVDIGWARPFFFWALATTDLKSPRNVLLGWPWKGRYTSGGIRGKIPREMIEGVNVIICS